MLKYVQIKVYFVWDIIQISPGEKRKGNRAPVRFTLNSAEQTPKPLERYLKTKGLPVLELCFSFALTPLRKVTLYSGQHGVWLCC